LTDRAGSDYSRATREGDLTTMKNRLRRNGFILLDLAVVIAVLFLVFLIQVSMSHRNKVIKEQKEARQQMKWIAQAEELYYHDHGRYTDRFDRLAYYLREKDTFVCPTTRELYRLWVDDVGRYTLESPAGHGSILSGDPDWSE